MNTEKIIQYLTQTHAPHAMLVYGSFADGSSNAHSDYDVLLIADHLSVSHDGTVIDGTPLDACLYSTQSIQDGIDPRDFLQLHDARLLLDERGMGAALQAQVAQYLASLPPKTEQEKLHLRTWCEKMRLRAQRGDAEGYDRWHWLLHDSLEIYCDLRDRFYFGPKKTILFIERNDPEGYALLRRALMRMDAACLDAWIAHVTQ